MGWGRQLAVSCWLLWSQCLLQVFQSLLTQSICPYIHIYMYSGVCVWRVAYMVSCSYKTQTVTQWLRVAALWIFARRVAVIHQRAANPFPSIHASAGATQVNRRNVDEALLMPPTNTYMHTYTLRCVGVCVCVCVHVTNMPAVVVRRGVCVDTYILTSRLYLLQYVRVCVCVCVSMRVCLEISILLVACICRCICYDGHDNEFSIYKFLFDLLWTSVAYK